MKEQFIIEKEIINKHFFDIASKYRSLRTTDSEPILNITNTLDHKSRIDIADVGCGDGRYTLEILKSLENRCYVHCIDTNEKMLRYLKNYLLQSKFKNFIIKKGEAERLPLENSSMDCIVTFNAIHHFNIDKFLSEVSRTLKSDGQLFIYTRLKNQNSRSIWGKYFPLFNETETRLFELDEFKHQIQQAEMKIGSMRVIGHHRSSSLKRLVEQARNHHYSTFSLFSKETFEESLKIFEQNIRDNFQVTKEIKWYDENILFGIKKGITRLIVNQKRSMS